MRNGAGNQVRTGDLNLGKFKVFLLAFAFFCLCLFVHKAEEKPWNLFTLTFELRHTLDICPNFFNPLKTYIFVYEKTSQPAIITKISIGHMLSLGFSSPYFLSRSLSHSISYLLFIGS